MSMLRLFALLLSPLLLQGCVAAVVGGGAAIATSIQDERPIATQLDDTALATNIDSRLIAEKDMPSRWVSVQVINGSVILTGYLPTQEHIKRAIYICQQVRGVRQVRSELQVGTPKIKNLFSDSWITTKVKTKLWGDKQVSGFAIKVETVNGKVYLQGVVKDFVARQHAIDLAHDVEGVTAVIDLMQSHHP